jgi:hypothetical protein
MAKKEEEWMAKRDCQCRDLIQWLALTPFVCVMISQVLTVIALEHSRTPGTSISINESNNLSLSLIFGIY